MANPFKWCALGVGGVVAVAHIGVLGHLMNYQMKTTEKYADRPQFPASIFPLDLTHLTRLRLEQTDTALTISQMILRY